MLGVFLIPRLVEHERPIPHLTEELRRRNPALERDSQHGHQARLRGCSVVFYARLEPRRRPIFATPSTICNHEKSDTDMSRIEPGARDHCSASADGARSIPALRFLLLPNINDGDGRSKRRGIFSARDPRDCGSIGQTSCAGQSVHVDLIPRHPDDYADGNTIFAGVDAMISRDAPR